MNTQTNSIKKIVFNSKTQEFRLEVIIDDVLEHDFWISEAIAIQMIQTLTDES
jgi:hypothetical protein